MALAAAVMVALLQCNDLLTKEQMRQLKGGNQLVPGGSIMCHMKDASCGGAGNTSTSDPCAYSMGYNMCVSWIQMGCDNNACCISAWCDWYY